MKKILAWALALMMTVALLPAVAEDAAVAAAAPAAADAAGEWILTEMMGVNPADMGMEITMTLNEDGTALLNNAGEAEEGTWSVDEAGQVTVVDANGAPAVFTLADGKLKSEEPPMTFDHPAAAEAEAGPVGEWVLKEIMGMNAADVGMETTMTLNEDGTALLSNNGEAEEGTWSVDEAGQVTVVDASGAPAVFTLADGQLKSEEPPMVFDRPAAAEAETEAEAGPVGKWVLKEIMGMNAADVGMQITMTLKEDGTATLVSNGQAEEGTWSADENGQVTVVDANGAPAVFTLAEGQLKSEEPPMVFEQEAAEGDLTGEWHLYQKISGETTVNAADFGTNITLVFNEDGTFTMSFGEDENTDGVWTQQEDGTITAQAADDEMPTSVVLEDGKLFLSVEDATMVFVREEQEARVKPQIIAAESEEVFLGNWTATEIESDGMIMPLSAVSDLGLTIQLNLAVEAGKATIGGELIFFTLPEMELPTVFEEGVLKLTGAEGVNVVLSYTDVGELACTLSAGEDTSFNLFLSRQE